MDEINNFELMELQKNFAVDYLMNYQEKLNEISKGCQFNNINDDNSFLPDASYSAILVKMLIEREKNKENEENDEKCANPCCKTEEFPLLSTINQQNNNNNTKGYLRSYSNCFSQDSSKQNNYQKPNQLSKISNQYIPYPNNSNSKLKQVIPKNTTISDKYLSSTLSTFDNSFEMSIENYAMNKTPEKKSKFEKNNQYKHISKSFMKFKESFNYNEFNIEQDILKNILDFEVFNEYYDTEDRYLKTSFSSKN